MHRGGDAKKGFAAGFVNGAAGASNQPVVEVVGGGVAAEAGGGKFKNGAATAAFSIAVGYGLSAGSGSGQSTEDNRAAPEVEVDASYWNDGNRLGPESVLDYNGYDSVVRNPHVRNDLSSLINGASSEGYVIKLTVTGGESYIDKSGYVRSSKDISLIVDQDGKNRVKSSAHNIENGSRGVDLRGRDIGIPKNEFDRLVRKYTNFKIGKNYSIDGHIHMNLPNNRSKYYYCPSGEC